MKSKLLHQDGGRRIFAVIFDKGDEVKEGLTAFAKEQRLGASQISAIGALSDVVLGYFDRDAKTYREIPVSEQVELLSLAGDVVLDKGQPSVHAHVVVGKSDGSAHGGHLVKAHVWPTLEAIISESPAHLEKAYDPEAKLALIKI